jgi:hypothetical protein
LSKFIIFTITPLKGEGYIKKVDTLQNSMEETKPREEIYLAKRKTHFGYDFAHIIPSSSDSPEQLNFFTTIDYYSLCWYLRGACLGKDSKNLDFYNGMPEVIKDKYTIYSLSDSKMYPLKEDVLEDILSNSKIKEKFQENIKTVYNFFPFLV